MNFFETIARFFQNGGHFMYPIAIVAVIGVAIAVERFLYLTVTRSRNRSLWQQIEPLLGQGNFRQAAQLAAQSDSAVGQILNYGLARVQNAKRRDDIEKAMEESLMGIVPRLEKRTHYLATFANLATLLGLLGTVMGLISAFGADGPRASGPATGRGGHQLYAAAAGIASAPILRRVFPGRMEAALEPDAHCGLALFPGTAAHGRRR